MKELRSAAKAAKSKRRRNAASPAAKCEEEHWIEVQLVDVASSAIADEKITLVTPDGKQHQCKTDAGGVVRIEGIPAGTAKLTFVDLDDELVKAKK